MPIETNVTTDESYNVLDPIDAAPAGSDIGAYVESDLTQIPLGEQQLEITFATEKANSEYLFDEAIIQNVVDDEPFVATFVITDRTLTGFQVTFDFVPDTGNYYFKWKVRIPTTLVNGIVISATTSGAEGTVTQVSVVANDGLTKTVTSATHTPTITLGIADAGIPLSKLAEEVVTGDVLTPANVETVTNKSIDGNNNTLSNIPYSALTGLGSSLNIGDVPDPDRFTTPLWDNDNKEFTWVGTAAERGVDKEVWIAIRTDDLLGDGTVASPFNAGGIDEDAKMAAFDGLMDDYQAVENVLFHLGPGTFFTDTQNRTWHPQNGWRLEGAGMYVTTIKLSTDSGTASIGAYDHEVIKTNLATLVDGLTVRNLTLDCNGTALSAKAPLVSGERNCSVYGASVGGSNILFEFVRCTNQYGALINLQESFGIGLGGGISGNCKNNHIRYCINDNPVGTYGAPFSLFGNATHALADSSVIGCQAWGKAGTGVDIGHNTGGVNAGYLKNCKVTDCHFVDCSGIFYQDTGTTDGVIVDACSLVGGFHGVAFVATGSPTKQNISITNNTINIKNRISGSIEGVYFGNSEATNVLISGNTVSYDTSGAAGGAQPWSYQLSKIVNLTLSNNCADDTMSATTGSGADESTPRTLFKNRNTDGGQIVGLEDNDSTFTVGDMHQTCGDTDVTWEDDKTVLLQSAALTTSRVATLPASGAFAPGTIITFIDRITTSPSGKMTWTVQGSDIMYFPAPLGGGYIVSDPPAPALFGGIGVQRFENFTGAWVMLAEAHPGFDNTGTAITGYLKATAGVISAGSSNLDTWVGIAPGAGVAAFIDTPSSANLASAVTGETGSGALVFGTSPSLTTPILSTATPASAAATGTAGTIVWDADYIYVCTATNTWKRAAIATW